MTGNPVIADNKPDFLISVVDCLPVFTVTEKNSHALATSRLITDQLTESQSVCFNRLLSGSNERNFSKYLQMSNGCFF